MMKSALIVLAGVCLFVASCVSTTNPVDARAEQAKQAIIRFLTVHNQASANQVAEWQAIPLAQVSSNKYTYGTYEIDLGRDFFGQMSWSVPIVDMGDAYQIAHGFLVINSNGTWEARAPTTCTFRMKSKDGQPPSAGDAANRAAPEK